MSQSMIALLSDTDARVILGLMVAIPATLSAVAAIYAAKANAKLKRNGGSTPADAINRIEASVDRLHQRHDLLSNRLDQLEDYVTNPPATGHTRRSKP